MHEELIGISSSEPPTFVEIFPFWVEDQRVSIYKMSIEKNEIEKSI